MNETNRNDQTVLVEAKELRDTITKIFMGLGVPEEDAAYEAEILVDADLRGVDTHGALLMPKYVKKIRNGVFNTKARMKVLREGPATLVVDADNGLGHITTARTMERCIAKAKDSGAAFAGLRNTNHAGCMGYYGIMAAEQGMIGYIVTDTHANLAPWGGTEPMLGNNPFAVGIPTGDSFPFNVVLDMALSVAAKAKVIKAAAKGDTIPEGWVTDRTGEPITDPEVIVGPLEKRKPFLLEPVGGYKGYGILVVNTILAGILSGAENYGPLLPSFGSQFSEVQHLGVSMGALDIERFLPLREFKERVDHLVTTLKGCDRVSGVEEIFLPGEIEYRTKERRLKEGIPVVRRNWDELQAILHELA